MMTSPTAQLTDFTRDVLGRYICNGFDEALASAVVRPFDTIVIGAGAFGAVVAHQLLRADTAGQHRILVLDAGPFVLPEHVQNLPMLGLTVPPPATTDPGLRNEVWGLPWLSDVPGGFPGLAYCVGGRSLFWGGWSPQPLASEIPSPPWPASVIGDLTSSYFAAAGNELSTTVANDFIYGPLQNALRQQLFDGLPQILDALALGGVPDHQATPAGTPRAALLDALGLPQATPSPPTDADLRNMMKLEAPLAVQGRATRPGFFALNKYSGVPLLIDAARSAWSESGGDDTRKRLMIVPLCHATQLVTALAGTTGHVSAVQTNKGAIPLPAGARVVLALATIENTRLALSSFAGLGLPHTALIGSNLQAHLRSNLIIRIPRAALTALAGNVQDLAVGALFLRGQHTVTGQARHFHVQITASGLGAFDTDAEARLFKVVPDSDTLPAFKTMSHDHVVIAMRGVAEMENPNPASQIRLSPRRDEFGVPRAFVTITPTASDGTMWDTLDTAALQVARVFAGGGPFDTVAQNRDGLGTTYHEAGTLRMGDDPATAVTNADARFHAVDNVYVTGPALFPGIGSPNPMLTGVALARRLADHLA